VRFLESFARLDGAVIWIILDSPTSTSRMESRVPTINKLPWSPHLSLIGEFVGL
jgi:hypothetical protein